MTSQRLQNVLASIDSLNQADPRLDTDGNQAVPKEWLYGQRMSQCLANYAPQASEVLTIAARAQHVERWKVARSEYPQGKAGYYQWRQGLGKMHGEIAAGVMAANGYPPQDCERVKLLLAKKNLRSDPEVQTLEDTICLVFLQFYLPRFAQAHPRDKVVSIIAKTWNKMSSRAQTWALDLELPDAMTELIEAALAG